MAVCRDTGKSAWIFRHQPQPTQHSEPRVGCSLTQTCWVDCCNHCHLKSNRLSSPLQLHVSTFFCSSSSPSSSSSHNTPLHYHHHLLLLPPLNPPFHSNNAVGGKAELRDSNNYSTTTGTVQQGPQTKEGQSSVSPCVSPCVCACVMSALFATFGTRLVKARKRATRIGGLKVGCDRRPAFALSSLRWPVR